MNVTVIVPKTLKHAVDGKRQVELGVPSTADIGDVLQTLFSLYPKLKLAVATERRVLRQQVTVFLDERGIQDLARGRGGLRNGDRVYLCAVIAEPVVATTRAR